MPYVVIGGSVEERAHAIADVFRKKPVMSINDAIAEAQAQYDTLLM